MKTGIVTLPLGSNIGGILQAYALQEVLRREGHSPRLVTLTPFPDGTRSRLLNRFLDFLPDRIGYDLLWATRYRSVIDRTRHLRRFVSTRIVPKTRKIGTRSSLLSAGRSGFDAFVAGSDQIWRREYARGNLLDAYCLGFAPANTVKVSYAASFGVSEWTFDEKETAGMRERLAGFSGISVRESSGVALCRDRLGLEATQVLDPTLLLDPSDYVALLPPDRRSSPEGGLFSYMLDPDPAKTEIVKSVAASTGSKPFTMLDATDDRRPSIEAWLDGFRRARFVVTDSFHGCAFSILFRKPFVAVGNAGRGLARFTSLLSSFGLEERLVDMDDPNAVRNLPTHDLDLPALEARLHALRRDSKEFLRRGLGGAA